MIRRALLFALPGALFAGLMFSGCGGGYGYTATVRSPRMVAIDNGVWAVAGYDDPVFYGGDYYWRYDNGYWYRSPYLGGWNQVRVGVVPPRIRGIRQPARYRRYVPPARARVRPVPRRDYRPYVRGQTRVRTPRGRAVSPRQGYYDRRDARRDRRYDRRDRRYDRRMERREARGNRARVRPR